MKTMILFSILAVTFSPFADMTLALSADGELRKQKEDEELEKHLALMDELEKQAEAEGWKRPVPPPLPEPPTRQQEEHYERIARDWAKRLWATNDCFVAKNWAKGDKPGDKPAWTHHLGVWTNEFTRSKVYTSRKPISESMPWNRVELRFRVDITNRPRDCIFMFLDDGRDSVLNVYNSIYKYSNVYYSVPDYKPVHTNEREARLRAAEYAAMFGVSNLWDKTRFECRSFGFFHGVWEFDLTPFVNGYPTLYPVCVKIADLPGYPLGEWCNCLYQIPTNLTTKVVLTSEEGKQKGIEYLNQYFPLKYLIPKLTFHSNRLEYISPTYDYIRPADDTGFSDYKPRWDEVALVWNNAFKKPEGTGFPWVSIYVDAATGEMLGGVD